MYMIGKNLSAILLFALLTIPQQSWGNDDCDLGYNKFSKKNYEEAYDLLVKGAESKAWSIKCEFTLGYMYDMGEGRPKNLNKALKWYLIAVSNPQQGFVAALSQERLGMLYTRIPYKESRHSRDYIRAYMWSSLAQENLSKEPDPRITDKEAKKTISGLEKVLSKAEIKKAKDLAVECKKKKYKNC